MENQRATKPAFYVGLCWSIIGPPAKRQESDLLIIMVDQSRPYSLEIQHSMSYSFDGIRKTAF